MAQPKLKEGASLRGSPKMDLWKRFREHVGEMPDPVVAIEQVPIDQVPEQQLEEFFLNLTGDSIEDVMAVCGKQDSARARVVLVHMTVLFANAQYADAPGPGDRPIVPKKRAAEKVSEEENKRKRSEEITKVVRTQVEVVKADMLKNEIEI